MIDVYIGWYHCDIPDLSHPKLSRENGINQESREIYMELSVYIYPSNVPMKKLISL